MIKRIFSLAMIALTVLSISSCKSDDSEKRSDNDIKVSATQKITVIYNSFKDVLPKFKFNSEPVENYQEGLSYTFSAECSENNYDRYIDKIKKAGFEENSVEANGYYAAYNAEKYYVEITLVGELITVFIKRT